MAGITSTMPKGYKATTAIRQFRGVVLSADDSVAEASVAGARIAGVCQEEVSADDATNGRIANILMLGITRAVASAAIARDARVAVGADGRFATATVGQIPVGVALNAAAAAGDHFHFELTPGLPAV